MLVRPGEVESPASAFGGPRSVQLSYGCKGWCVAADLRVRNALLCPAELATRG